MIKLTLTQNGNHTGPDFYILWWHHMGRVCCYSSCVDETFWIMMSDKLKTNSDHRLTLPEHLQLLFIVAKIKKHVMSWLTDRQKTCICLYKPLVWTEVQEQLLSASMAVKQTRHISLTTYTILPYLKLLSKWTVFVGCYHRCYHFKGKSILLENKMLCRLFWNFVFESVFTLYTNSKNICDIL